MAGIKIYGKFPGTKLQKIIANNKAEIIIPNRNDWCYSEKYQYFFDSMIKYGITPRLWLVRFSTNEARFFTLVPFASYAALTVKNKNGTSLYVGNIFSGTSTNNPVFHHELCFVSNWKFEMSNPDELDKIPRNEELRSSLRNDYVEGLVNLIAKIV